MSERKAIDKGGGRSPKPTEEHRTALEAGLTVDDCFNK